jgi:hypothetical protein
MVSRGIKMGSSKTSKRRKNSGQSLTEITSVEEFFEYVRGKSREFDLAMRAVGDEQVQEPNHRREQPVQRPEYKTFQSFEEVVKELQSTYYPYWYADPTGDGRPMVTGWHLGFRGKTGDEPDEV